MESFGHNLLIRSGFHGANFYDHNIFLLVENIIKGLNYFRMILCEERFELMQKNSMAEVRLCVKIVN